jgi:hypothetical protein
MESLRRQLRGARWGLARAKSLAKEIASNKAGVRALVKELFGQDVEIRKRAADVARRVTELDAAPLELYADELAGLLAEIPVEESRTRWHLGLVVARVAHTREQRLRAARLMELLMEEESNVARCSAVEGIGLLASEEPSLRGVAADMIARALREGTLAMKNRAKYAKRRLEKAWRVKGEPQTIDF